MSHIFVEKYVCSLIQIIDLVGVSCDTIHIDAKYDYLHLYTLIFEKLHAKLHIQLKYDMQLDKRGSKNLLENRSINSGGEMEIPKYL